MCKSPMFARRHYEAIAKLLDEGKPEVGHVVNYADLVDRFASMLAEDNARFDRGRFKAACNK